MIKVKAVTKRIYDALDEKPMAFILAVSVFLNCFIEIMGRRSFSDFLSYIVKRPHLFLLNCLIIMCTYVIVLLVRRRAFMVLLVTVIWLACGITNCSLMFLRSLPFTARDLFLVYDGLRIAKAYFTITDIILLVSALLALMLLLVLGYIKLPKSRKPENYLRSLAGASSVILVLLFITTTVTGDIALASDFDNINAAYEECGFAFCFASSIFDAGISEPEGYGREAMDNIKKSIGREYTGAGTKPNIIFVQLESFFDPAAINGLTLSKNPIANFTGLRDECPSGYLTVPSLGAGTVNTEFEVLTGMSVDFFGVGEYPFDSTLRDRTCESLAYALKNLGYTAHAVHNHEGTFYSRNTVYSNLGFDTFTSLEYMKGVEFTKTGWAKDAVLTDCIMDCLDSTENTDFVFAVTVQGHGKYPDDYTGSPITVENSELENMVSHNALEYYLCQLEETDRFIGDLISRLENSPEKTVVVFYGDHLPTLGLLPEQHETGSLYNTEYVIWSNFGLKGSDSALSAYELSAHVLEMLGIRAGTIFRFHQSCAGNEDYYSSLEMLEYDMLFGEKYIYGGNSPFEPTDLKLGINEILLSSVYYDGAATYVSGSGFTPFSAIYINGSRRETRFINSGLLSTTHEIRDGDIVTVCQTDSDMIILSSTEETTYRGEDEARSDRFMLPLIPTYSCFYY